MRPQQPDRPCGIGDIRGDVARDAVREAECGDTGSREGVADERPALDVADPATNDGDAADRLAVGEMEDGLDLGAGDGERDPLEH